MPTTERIEVYPSIKHLKRILPLLAAAFCLIGRSGAAVLPAEKLLPDDTLAVLAIPDFARTRDIYKNSPQGQLWRDPTMKAFKDKFVDKFKSEYIVPLEHDLGVNFDDYTGLPQGQFTVALVQNGWGTKDKASQTPAVLLLLDTKDKSSQLKTSLADLRKKWIDAGKTVRTEKIRDVDFSIITLSTNDLPKTLKPAANTNATAANLPEPLENPELKKLPRKELYIGQADSLLIMGNSARVIEKVLASMAGDSVKTLSDLPAFSDNQNTLFRDAPALGWVNTKVLVDILTQPDEDTSEVDSASNPFSFVPTKIAAALGLNGLKTLAFSYHYSNEGARFNLVLNVPEADRAGIFKILAGEAKEYNPPAFVPADAVKFQRWRIDGQKTWATVQQVVKDINPQWLNSLDFMLSTAESAAKEKDPDFDIKKNLFGNLGDDIITYSKAPKGDTVADLNSAPSLFLLGSPNPEKLSAALRSLLVFTGQSGTPTEREFLGKKIYSMPTPESAAPGFHAYSYASGGGYLAISTDPAMLEEFLRSSQEEGKSLRNTAGLADATQKVTGSGTCMFGYSNDSESMRTSLTAFKKDPDAILGPLAAAAGLANKEKIQDWFDVSLLPPFEQIAKYFYFTVYGGGATADALVFKVFTPAPPQLKN